MVGSRVETKINLGLKNKMANSKKKPSQQNNTADSKQNKMAASKKKPSHQNKMADSEKKPTWRLRVKNKNKLRVSLRSGLGLP